MCGWGGVCGWMFGSSFVGLERRWGGGKTNAATALGKAEFAAAPRPSPSRLRCRRHAVAHPGAGCAPLIGGAAIHTHPANWRHLAHVRLQGAVAEPPISVLLPEAADHVLLLPLPAAREVQLPDEVVRECVRRLVVAHRRHPRRPLLDLASRKQQAARPLAQAARLRAHRRLLHAIHYGCLRLAHPHRLHLHLHGAVAALRRDPEILPVVLAPHRSLLERGAGRHQQERLPDAPDDGGDAAVWLHHP